MLALGYLGIEKNFPEQISLHYHIKEKETNQEMSKEEEKDYNKIHSNKKSIVIEHIICRLKKYNRRSDIVAGLVNY